MAHPCDGILARRRPRSRLARDHRPDPRRTAAQDRRGRRRARGGSRRRAHRRCAAQPCGRRGSRRARQGRRGRGLMKGSLHTDELMAAVVRRDGLRTARRISHCFVMDVPRHESPLIITDAAVNIAPSLEDKVDIVQNAIDLAHALRVETVRVAILSAMETVNPKVPSTIEAAALCKMADRGQITGADPRRAARPRQRHRSRRGQDQEHPLAGRRAGRRARRAQPRGGQHAGQEPDLSGRRGCRRDRARCARADHPDEPGRLADHPPRVLRRGLPRRRGAAHEARPAGRCEP